MDFLTDILGVPLGYIMQFCHFLFSDYGLAILLFTLLTKIVILPVGIWVHKNSIKMVKIQPAINRLKAKFFGDSERIAEEQSKLFKEQKYRPMASLVPLAIQIILLLGVVAVIYHPFQYVFNTPDEVVNEMFEVADVDTESNYAEIYLVNAVQENPDAFAQLAANSDEANLAYNNAKDFDLDFFGFDLSWTPIEAMKTDFIAILAPLLAGLSSWFLCHMQNKINVLQSEQSKANKYGTMIFSVVLSLYLGFFVPAGVALYWMASNLFGVLQVVLLNAVIPPKNYVDYEELEASRKELEALNALGSEKKGLFAKDPNAKREKADYKRFFSITNKHLVFFSEKSGFYKYFENIIEALLKNTNVTIHYVTNDPNDKIFEKALTEPKIKPYYIGPKKIITFMMKMDADIVVMTTPELDSLHIKRSYVKKDTEYIYTFHAPTSTHMCVKEDAHDNFDTIFCVGPHQVDEIREAEKVRNLKEKNLVPVGFGVIDNLIEMYEKMEKTEKPMKQILIAPSWQEDNIFDSCLDEILPQLLHKGNKVIIRPHPEYVKRFKGKMDAIVEKYKSEVGDDFEIELDFSSNRTIWESDLLITDWSGIAYEFSYATKKPTLFINTTMKVLNPNYKILSCVPVEIAWKDQVGVSLEMDEVNKVGETVAELLGNPEKYSDKITDALNRNIFNIGHSGVEGAKYIYNRIIEKQKNKK